jgi:hypothetical protein
MGPRAKTGSREEGRGRVWYEAEWGEEAMGKVESTDKGKELSRLLGGAEGRRDNPSQIERDSKGGQIGAGGRGVWRTGITEEDRAVRRGKGDGKVVWGPGECSEGVGFEEGSPGAPRKSDGVVGGQVWEAVEGIEEGAGKEVVECCPLEGSSHALELLWRERHGRGNDSIEEGGSSGGSVVGNGGGRARGNVFSNEVGGGFWRGGALIRARGMDDEARVGECWAERGGVLVAMLGGDEGEGEDVVNINEGVEGGSVEGVKKGVHNRVWDGGYEIPPKWGSGEAEVDRSEVGREDSKDEGVDVGGRE